MESARIPDIEIEETPMHGSKMQVAKEPLTPQKIADSVNQIWDIYWSGLGLSDQDLVDAIIEHIKDMK